MNNRRLLTFAVLFLALISSTTQAADRLESSDSAFTPQDIQKIVNDAEKAYENMEKAKAESNERLERERQEILERFGAEMMKNADVKIVNGSKVDRARFLFAEYCKALNSKGVGVNSSYFDRLGYLFRTGDPARWTCGDHTMNLDAILKGAGFNPIDTMPIQADTSLSYDFSANCNHGALALMNGDGEIFIFDAWWMAVANNESIANSLILHTEEDFLPGNIEFSHANGVYDVEFGKAYNGMSVEKWEATMKKAKYGTFTIDYGTHNHKTAAEALKQWREKPRVIVTRKEGMWGHSLAEYSWVEGDYKAGALWIGMAPGSSKYVILQGPMKFFYSNGSTEAVYECKDGVYDGPFKTYWENGKLQSEGTYSKGSVVKEAYKVYDKEGNPSTSEKTGIYP